MGHYSIKCPNLPTLPIRENVGSFIQRFSIEKKGKIQGHLIEPMSEGREKTLIHLKRNFNFFENVIDVMAQTKQPVEDSIHFDITVKRFEEIARALKKKKN